MLLAKAQPACCAEVEIARNRPAVHDFEVAVLRMFEAWREPNSSAPTIVTVFPGATYARADHDVSAPSGESAGYLFSASHLCIAAQRIRISLRFSGICVASAIVTSAVALTVIFSRKLVGCEVIVGVAPTKAGSTPVSKNSRTSPGTRVAVSPGVGNFRACRIASARSI